MTTQTIKRKPSARKKEKKWKIVHHFLKEPNASTPTAADWVFMLGKEKVLKLYDEAIAAASEPITKEAIHVS